MAKRRGKTLKVSYVNKYNKKLFRKKMTKCQRRNNYLLIIITYRDEFGTENTKTYLP